jgi:hypothetical protein
LISATHDSSVRNTAPRPRAFEIAILPKEAVEVFVVAHLIGADRRGDLYQRRLRASRGEHAVKGRGAGFDDASGRHLEHAPSGESIDRAGAVVFSGKPAIDGPPIEAEPGHVEVASERQAMVDLFLLPLVLEPVHNLGIAPEEADEIASVETRGDLDEQRGGDHMEKQRVPTHEIAVDRVRRYVAQPPLSTSGSVRVSAGRVRSFAAVER